MLPDRVQASASLLDSVVQRAEVDHRGYYTRYLPTYGIIAPVGGE